MLRLKTKKTFWVDIYSFFWETAVVPSLNPLRNLLRTILRWRMRPVPVVFLLLALTDQLYPRVRGEGYPHMAQRFFWMWKDTLSQRMHSVCVLLRLLPNELVPLVWKRQGTHHVNGVGSRRSLREVA